MGVLEISQIQEVTEINVKIKIAGIERIYCTFAKSPLYLNNHNPVTCIK